MAEKSREKTRFDKFRSKSFSDTLTCLPRKTWYLSTAGKIKLPGRSHPALLLTSTSQKDFPEVNLLTPRMLANRSNLSGASSTSWSSPSSLTSFSSSDRTRRRWAVVRSSVTSTGEYKFRKLIEDLDAKVYF
ncbi:hypothetical protein EYF80_049157 [Liparis tanakae]|uniref:Uncharacterized protein n=1 Tax=Liparis tanakae TaxID=230148 RepID=A0A4Z2FHJ0_9TELE|nr:hypothetical protein EYF80_049157 [Liparis tanakae]